MKSCNTNEGAQQPKKEQKKKITHKRVSTHKLLAVRMDERNWKKIAMRIMQQNIITESWMCFMYTSSNVIQCRVDLDWKIKWFIKWDVAVWLTQRINLFLYIVMAYVKW